MLKMVDGTGIIGVDMICPLGVSTPQPPNYDRVELEGTGMLVLPNSLDAPLERLELGGKTEQVQTTGKNLANPSEFVVGTLAGDTGNIIKLKQYITTGYIPVIPGKRYSTSCGNKFSAHTIIAYDKEKTKINSPINMSSEMPEGAAYIRLTYKKIDMTNVTESDMEELKKVCMVNEGSTVLPYEPYTGGKPSPSPEYPQEIKNSGMWNEETRKYEVDVKVTGRNLFNGKLLKGKFITDDMNVVSDLVTMNTFDKPVEIEPNTDYVISANGVIWEGNINVYDENGKKIVQHFTGKFKTPSNAKYIRASISNARAPIDSKIQMEYGTAMNEFEQYHQPQTLTLTSDRPLTKWDRLVEQGGQIGWLYKSKIIDGFDGQSSITNIK